jgi:pullulanase/glycogen debranching enzyme
MNEQSRVSHPIYNLLPTEIEGFDSLAELASDMRWSCDIVSYSSKHWFDPKQKQFGCLVHDEQHPICLMFNASADAVDFSLPPQTVSPEVK